MSGGTYVEPVSGEERKERRSRDRSLDDVRIAHLFEGFDNMIRNSDPYNAGYLDAMRQEFAGLVTSLLTAAAPAKDEGVIRSPTPAPTPGSLWVHRNGGLYVVDSLANMDSARPEYPHTVVYRSTQSGCLWARELGDWARSMRPANLATLAG